MHEVVIVIIIYDYSLHEMEATQIKDDTLKCIASKYIAITI
jgi:hypothetical protein